MYEYGKVVFECCVGKETSSGATWESKEDGCEIKWITCARLFEEQNYTVKLLFDIFFLRIRECLVLNFLNWLEGRCLMCLRENNPQK